jgi:hypothetical protein
MLEGKYSGVAQTESRGLAQNTNLTQRQISDILRVARRVLAGCIGNGVIFVIH